MYIYIYVYIYIHSFWGSWCTREATRGPKSGQSLPKQVQEVTKKYMTIIQKRDLRKSEVLYSFDFSKVLGHPRGGHPRGHTGPTERPKASQKKSQKVLKMQLKYKKKVRKQMCFNDFSVLFEGWSWSTGVSARYRRRKT